MDKLDKQIINRIQRNFPLTSRPYQQLAQELGLSEEELLKRLKALKAKGVIRHLGAVFDSQKLGFSSTLVAMQVPEDKLEQTARVVNAYPGVTHNYQRDTDYNMWFTLTAESGQRIEEILEEIRDKTGIKKILNLPATKLFKIKVNFQL